MLGHGSTQAWLIDSGASHPMSPCAEDFCELRPSQLSSVTIANGQVIPVVGEGDVCVRGLQGNCLIRDVQFVPDLDARLLSVPAIFERGGKVDFAHNECRIFGRHSREPLLVAPRVASGWELDVEIVSHTAPFDRPFSTNCMLCRGDKPKAQAVQGSGIPELRAPWEVWHNRLGHVGLQDLKRMFAQKLASGMRLAGDMPQRHECADCLQGKMHNLPFGKAQGKASKPLERIHMDLMGKFEAPSAASRARYCLTLKDEATGYAWVRFLQKKKHAAKAIQDFFAMAERQFDTKIKSFRSDRGGEFVSDALSAWMDERGVIHQLTVPYTPQQNGVAERYNRTLCERGRTMLLAAEVPVRFWEHALTYANWCSNRTPASGTPMHATPFFALHGRIPDVSMAKVFGCLAHIWISPQGKRKPKKMGARSEVGVFVGIPDETKGWEFWLPATSELGRISRNAYFHESQFYPDWKRHQREPVPMRDKPSEDPFPPALFDIRFYPTKTPKVSSEQPLGQGEVGVQEVQVDDFYPILERYESEGEGELDRPQVLEPASVGGDEPQRGEVESQSDDSDAAISIQEVEQPVGASLGLDQPGALEGSIDSLASSNSEVSLHQHIVPVVQVHGGQGEGEHSPASSVSNHSSASQSVVIALREAPALPEAPRRSTRVSRPPLVFSPTMSGSHIYRRAHTANGQAFVAAVPLARWSIPRSVAEANRGELGQYWLDARLTELSRLQEMRAWELVDPPLNANILQSLWVFAVKLKPDNSVDRFKARLVVNGSGQKQGIDFEKTFANTAGGSTIRLFLAMCCVLGLHIHQLDVTTAFLYGDVDKEIYMRQPPGHNDGSGKVCKLLRSLYGLKQAPRIWGETLCKALLDIGFVRSKIDPSLFWIERDGVRLWLLDFVDDMLLACQSMELIQWVKDQLMQRFKMTDMGPAQKYVGIHIHRDVEKGEMWLHQASYCLELLEKFKLVGKPFPDTPLPADFVLSYLWESLNPDEDLQPPEEMAARYEPPLSPSEQKLFQRMVGSLNYAAHTTRLDIAYAVSQLSRVTQNPRARHLKAAERCILYLAGTADLGIHFSRRAGMHLEAYADASLTPSGNDRSMTGFILQVGGGPVTWSARKQDRKTSSSCDSECLAVMTACQYVQGARDQLEELGCMQVGPTPLFNDNTVTVRLCTDAEAHKKSVQLTMPMGYVRDFTLKGVIAPQYIRTTEQPADMLTKRLSPGLFEECKVRAGMRPLPAEVLTLKVPAATEVQGGV